MSYFLAPFIGWFVAGVLKFVINHVRYGDARERIGNGGFPSNHTTIMTTIVALIGFKEGFSSPIFGLGVAITYIVIIDAIGLRRHVGRHAEKLNKIRKKYYQDEASFDVLRESMGHTPFEVFGGICLGTLIGYTMSIFS
jgi:hypothetical protein